MQRHISRVGVVAMALTLPSNCSYYQVVDVEFDPAKDRRNLRDHGISLQRAEDFDFDAASYQIDDREDYGEIRYRAVSFLDGELFSLIFTMRDEAVRAISLRAATRQEESDYV